MSGVSCNPATSDCAKFKLRLCEVIRKEIHPLEYEQLFDCVVTLTAHETQSHLLNFDMDLTLETAVQDALKFQPSCRTFYWALHQAFVQLRNDLTVNIEITEVVSFQITGTLYRKGVEVNLGKLSAADKCAAETQLADLAFSGDLLSVLYRYATKDVMDFKFDGARTGRTSFTVTYPMEFFTKTKIDPNCDFKTALQFGFSHPVKTAGYYFGSDVTITTFKITIPMTFGDKLNATTCYAPGKPCSAYKGKLCDNAQKPFMCGLVPLSSEACLVELPTVLPSDGVTDKATIAMKLDTQASIYPINLQCSTFGAMYKYSLNYIFQQPPLTVKTYTG
ncbi:unnamed protein product [Echinostoma caproni]|uniref:Uncharacterized protein n=1 Tax=Echinostoma caproni TaxID=27848 RepID=A0A3P8LAR4_9TREM|nr:unnamed protein product [Echinostoma caproni]